MRVLVGECYIDGCGCWDGFGVVSVNLQCVCLVFIVWCRCRFKILVLVLGVLVIWLSKWTSVAVSMVFSGTVLELFRVVGVFTDFVGIFIVRF